MKFSMSLKCASIPSRLFAFLSFLHFLLQSARNDTPDRIEMTAPLPHSRNEDDDRNTTQRQRDQLRRFLYTSLSNKDKLPLLLPLSPILQDEAAWIQVDLQCQQLLAQLLRFAVIPWYSKLTSDRELIEEVVHVIKYGLASVFDAVTRRTKVETTTGSSINSSSSSPTRLESFLLFDIPAIVRLHYVEVRRAKTMSYFQREEHRQSAAAITYLASNPHPALSLDPSSKLQVDEEYIDVLLLAILQAVLPADHLCAYNESLIIMDVIKGGVQGQLRVKGSGSWVLVRWLLNILEEIESTNQETKAASSAHISKEARWYDSANLLLGLGFVYAILKAFFLYLVVVYLDLFTPTSEPKKRVKRRKGEAEMTIRSESRDWTIEPLFDVLVEALDWKHRMLTRSLEQWIRIGLAWGGNRLIERQIKGALVHWTRPEYILEQVTRLQGIVTAMQGRPPPDAAIEPDISIQREEYNALVTKMLDLIERSSTFGLLFGHSKENQRQTIDRALSPFLEPPIDPTRSSTVQVANAKTMLTLLESFAILINPTLED
jgi:hypothetical protein